MSSNINNNSPAESTREKGVRAQAPTKARQFNWYLEIFNLLLSLAAVITIIALLFYAQDRPLSQYNFFVSFNTVIAILAAVARPSFALAVGSCLGQVKWNWFMKRQDSVTAFAKFEDASRGPWGSLWLLLWLNVRHWTVIGAVVTILALGFEPFIQAVIHYDGEMAVTNITPAPAIGVRRDLNVGRLIYAGGGIRPMGQPAPYYSQPDLALSAAVFTGFQNKSLSSANFVCASSNCTWSPFISIGICNKCHDISQHLKQENKTVFKTYTDSPQIGRRAAWSKFTTNKIYLLPYVNLTNTQGFYDESSEFLAAGAVTSSRDTMSFQDMDTLIATIGVIMADDEYERNITRWEDTKATAHECALYFCTRAYKSEVKQGVLQETTLGTWQERKKDSYLPYNYFGHEQLFNQTPGDSLCPGLIHFSEPLQLHVPEDEARQLDLPTSKLDFNITQSTICGAITFLRDELFLRLLKWPTPDPRYQPMNQTYIRPGALQVMIAQSLHSHRKDLGAVLGQVAASMTNSIRDLSSNTTMHAGVQQEWVTKIKIRWKYMAFPLLVYAAGCAFVMATMLDTRRLGLHPWKTDVLATLVHALDPGSREALRGAEAEGLLQRTAREMPVRLQDNRSGLELKGT